MNFAKKMSLMLSLTAALALSAHAQDARAKFNIPYDVRLGETVLPAGAYTANLSLEGSAKLFIVPEGRRGTSAIVLPVTTEGATACTVSSLSLQREGSQWNVTSMCFAEPQIALTFALPAEKEAVAIARTAPAAKPGR